MALKREIERKFLVDLDRLPPLPPGSQLVQGYLGLGPTVRVRTESTPDGQRRGYLTIKGEGLIGRDEFEYEIPFAEAFQMMRLSRWAPVSKVRHRLPIEGDLEWEVDIFDGANAGLVVAEIELPDVDTVYPTPPWLGQEVSRDPAYKNSMLAQAPYSTWGESNVSTSSAE